MKMIKVLLGFCMLLPMAVVAGEVEIKKNLNKAMPSLGFDVVEKSEIPGLYRVVSKGGETLFSNEDGTFFVTGDMYSTVSGRLQNLSEVKREKTRADMVAGISSDKKIVFPASGDVKAKIAVFTDIDCGYCRKLHKEVPALNDMGVEVSYLAYPRAGVGSESFGKYVSAWCAEDKLNAMTLAKNGRSIPNKDCDNPIAEQFLLGQKMGVTGTPAIVLEDGRLIPGYLTAAKLGKALGI